ncbi:MAG: hypothetical protein LUF90_08165 [Rikenellaceae bacterium]|nr:hypothetical protein [Rikenellaceae bacterium]
MKAIKYRIERRVSHLTHIFRFNHWRGHGIHSPFIYGMVREIISKKDYRGKETILPDTDFSKSDRYLLDSIKNYLGYKLCYCLEDMNPKEKTIYVVTSGTKSKIIRRLYEKCQEEKAECCIAVLHAVRSKNIFYLCKELSSKNECVVLDFHKNIFFLFHNDLNNKHYRIKRNLLS